MCVCVGGERLCPWSCSEYTVGGTDGDTEDIAFIRVYSWETGCVSEDWTGELRKSEWGQRSLSALRLPKPAILKYNGVD